MARRKESDRAQQNNDDSDSNPNDELEEEPDFDDPEGYEDDISEQDLMGDLIRQRPKETDGVESIVVIDGVPQVGPERIEKLQNVLKKLFQKFGKITNEYYPLNSDGSTKGHVFIEYSNASEALEVLKGTNGYKFDKNHTFTVNLLTDFEKYNDILDKWENPVPQPFKEQGCLQYYLLDQDACDQFSVVYEQGDKVAVYLNTQPEPSLLEERPRWTETLVRWSPLGTYLATFHAKGIALWGGEKFQQIVRFSHPGVQFIDFSPCEKYLVSFSPLADSRATDEPQAIIIWDVLSGLKRRAFNADKSQALPIFKWSHDDKYFARMGVDMLSVYETPSFGLLDKKSIKVQGIRDFAWSPTDNTIAYWVGEEKDTPARVTLLELPSRNEVRVKNLFSVADCKMYWQKSGDYLCVKVDRYAKLRKDKSDIKYSGIYYNLEVFHMREKQIPVDSVEIKETIQAFAWEPVGTKFAVIHGEPPSTSVSFYEVKTGQTPTMVKKYERKPCNQLYWAPSGQFIVLAGLRAMSGTLEFVDTHDFTVMNTGEHFMATDVEWDPTGRYVATAVSWWGHKVDNAYWLWSFQGRILKRVALDKFCQLQWRPRPPSLLSAQQIKDIKKSLKKYSAQFEVKDRLKMTKASKELVEKRRKLMQEYEDLRKQKQEEYAEQRRRRIELRNNVDTDETEGRGGELEEETVEFFIKEETTFIDE
uniref:Eukaryotic translation initiation factor 3 subunit B n=1 Tax=Daphnia similis TaxID=35528 RepID=A0A4Y7LQF9_9CRUS|nr:EOG090X01UY [Daphnia similis]SVE70899.1 EOG090X01UY [Daphnia similis]SVE71530.1 EOG090X01UY [Daphnia similis]SVE72163.1 EOG090X01UY [Daphnia similis]